MDEKEFPVPPKSLKKLLFAPMFTFDVGQHHLYPRVYRTGDSKWMYRIYIALRKILLYTERR
jgi:hypothetical protein